jgi:hypothetical protein
MKTTKLLFCFLLLSAICQEIKALTFCIDDNYTHTTNESNFYEDSDESTGTAFADLNTISITDDGTNLAVTIAGDNIPAGYDLYIDIDNNPATGFNNGGNILGAEFLIQFGVIYDYTGGAGVADWSWANSTAISVVDTGVTSRVFNLSRTRLGLPSSGTALNVVYDGKTAGFLPTSGMQAYTTSVAETVVTNLTSMTLTDDATNLTLTILGSGIGATYGTFIDIDNNAATGYVAGDVNGADFYIENGSFFSYIGTGGGWGWTASAGLSVINASGSRELVINRTNLGLPLSGTVINAKFFNTGATSDVLPSGGGMQSYTTTTAQPVPNLTSLTITDDINLIMTILGPGISATHDAFIDTDNNAATGYSGGSIAGADFYIGNDIIYSYSGVAPGWGWTATTGLTVINATGSRKLIMDRTILGLTSSGAVINSLFLNTISSTDALPTSGMQSYTITSAVSSTSWEGDESNVWNLAGNWDNGIPTSSSIVTIPEVATAPEIGTSTGATVGNLTITEADGLTIISGGSLIVSGASIGNLTHKRTLAKDAGLTNAWYSVSSPLSGVTAATVQANNTFAAGSGGSRIGLATYNNNGSGWNYFTTGSTDAIISGTGLIAKLNHLEAGSDLSFTGTYTTGLLEPTIVQGAASNNFNFMGNPYLSYINLGTFFTDNNVTDRLSEATIWIWDENLNGVNMGGYVSKMSNTDGSFEIAPGQGFFVSSGTAGSNKITFNQSNQSHKTESFLKATSREEIQLKISQDELIHQTKIYYIEGTSTDFDNGYDGSLFGGVNYDLAVYSELVSNNQGKKLGVQSLPNSDYENMIIPLGVKAKADEITFTADALNLPSGVKVYLEDRFTKTFTRLDEANTTYKVTLAEAINGIGRFYLHTAQKALSIDTNIALDNISIYKTNKSTIRITGMSQGTASIKLYNILGKEMMSSSFNSDGVKDFSLPKLATGVYIIQLETEAGKLNKKIILE